MRVMVAAAYIALTCADENWVKAMKPRIGKQILGDRRGEKAKLHVCCVIPSLSHGDFLMYINEKAFLTGHARRR